LADCPFIKYSANVDNTPKEQTEEEKQIDRKKYKERVEKAKKKQEAAEKQHAQMKISAAPGEKSDEKKNGKVTEKENSKDKGKDNGVARTIEIARTMRGTNRNTVTGVTKDLEVETDEKSVMRIGRGENVGNLKLGKRKKK